MGQVNGFWLTWHYFGYSKIYGTLVAIVELLGATLLMFRRTTLFGACLLAPVMVNIVTIDILFGIGGALPAAVMLLLAMLILIASQWQELVDLFWTSQKYSNFERDSKTRFFAQMALRGGMFLAAFAFTYWVANYNNRAPTPLDGTWEIVGTSNQEEQLPQKMFFEYNRAFLCVFKSKDGSYQGHHFEVNSQNKTLQIWEHWLKKGEMIFTGVYNLQNNSLTLHGKYNGSLSANFELRKVSKAKSIR